jgi:hypothetical protein
MRLALELLSLVSADDALEHHPPYLINEAIVDRVVSSEHSINKRPIERVDKYFWIEKTGVTLIRMKGSRSLNSAQNAH